MSSKTKDCKLCYEWKRKHKLLIEELINAGVKASGERLNDRCVCDIKNNRNRPFEDKELIIIK